MAKTVKLTKAAIAALPQAAPGKREVYKLESDGAIITGLELRVSSTHKTFSILRRKKNGSPERFTIGRFPEITPEQVKDMVGQIAVTLRKGESVRATGKNETTLGDLFDDFLQNKRTRNGRLTEKTKQNYKSDFSRYFGKLAKKKLSEVKDTTLAKIHSTAGKTAPYGANRGLALISSLYTYARERKLFTGQNPAFGIKKFPEDSRDRFLQSDELPRFFQALAEEQNETIRDYVLLSLLTGARRSNVLAMQWKDVNLDRGEWRIPITKNGTPQTVTLSPEAIDVLMNRKPSERAQFVFPGDGKSGHLIEPKKGWKRILDRAGIDDLRIHDLRRTLGSWQAKSGASLAIIGKSLNHKNTSTTAIYARLDLDPVRESVNTATSAMMAAAGLKEAAEVVKLKKA